MSQNTMTMKMMIEQAENDLLHTYNRYQVPGFPVFHYPPEFAQTHVH